MDTPFPISSSKENELKLKMLRYGISENDFEEKFVRGSGAGGQKINKTSSCVWLKHLPSGTEVKCQEGRSQALNRFLARRLLVEQIISKIEGEKSAQRQMAEKIRRQKRKRSKRAKEKMLGDKRNHSQKKQLRKVGRHDSY